MKAGYLFLQLILLLLFHSIFLDKVLFHSFQLVTYCFCCFSLNSYVENASTKGPGGEETTYIVVDKVNVMHEFAHGKMQEKVKKVRSYNSSTLLYIFKQT